MTTIPDPSDGAAGGASPAGRSARSVLVAMVGVAAVAIAVVGGATLLRPGAADPGADPAGAAAGPGGSAAAFSGGPGASCATPPPNGPIPVCADPSVTDGLGAAGDPGGDMPSAGAGSSGASVGITASPWTGASDPDGSSPAASVPFGSSAPASSVLDASAGAQGPDVPGTSAPPGSAIPSPSALASSPGPSASPGSSAAASPSASPPPSPAPTSAAGFKARDTVVPMAFPLPATEKYAYGDGWRAPRDGAARPYEQIRGVAANGTYLRAHSGLDLQVKLGTIVRAPLAGKVIDPAKRWKPWDADRYGKVVAIESTEPTSPGYVVLLAHLSWMKVKPGDVVERGQIVGRTGKTGNAAGTVPHLHLELHAPFRITYGYAHVTRRLDVFDAEPSVRAADPKTH